MLRMTNNWWRKLPVFVTSLAVQSGILQRCTIAAFMEIVI